jgi:F-type H+-transporting ATPase subunit b
MRIDWWTLALQTVNVLILIWLLGRFLYRPVTAIVDRRQGEARKLLADAAAARQQAEGARLEAERMRAAVLAEQERELSKAHQVADAERATLLARAREDALKLRVDAEADIAHDRAVAQAALMERACTISVEIARRLLGRVPAAMTWEPFLEGLSAQVAALSPGMRSGFVSAIGRDQAIELATPAGLTSQEADRVGRALEKVFGSRLPLAFRCDPAVLAGIELRSRHAAVCNSFRADLEQIRKELERDDEQRNGAGQVARSGQADR